MAHLTSDADPPADPGQQGPLFSLSFAGLLITQLLTAVNDNVFRWLVIGIAKDYVPQEHVSVVLAGGSACFVLPYLVLAAPAGYLADRFSKRNVIVVCKLAEVLIMALGVLAIYLENVGFLFTVVALLGCHSALFAPAKMGSIPEMLKPQHISAANGLFGLTTLAATCIGTALGGGLRVVAGYRGTKNPLPIIGVVLGVAVLGFLASLLIKRLTAGNPNRKIPWNAPLQTFQDLRLLASHRALLRVAVGMVFFWAVGMLAQLNIDQLAFEGGGLTESAKNPLLISLIFGVGAGSVLAGLWSGGRVELGILPLGAFGVAASGLLLFTVPQTIIEGDNPAWNGGFVWACALLFALGTSAGLFSVPLESYMQHRSDPHARGSILSAANFMIFSGMLLASFLYLGMRTPTYPGTLDNVSAKLRGLPLSAPSVDKVDELEQEFKRAWSTEPPPKLEEFVKRASPDEKSETLARLLYVELQQRAQRQEKQEIVHKDEYYERFPNDKQLVKAVFDQSGKLPLFNSRQIFLLTGFFTLPIFLYILWIIPQACTRFAVWIGSYFFYRIRQYGRENLPETGGALLVSNHISWLDGLLFLLISTRTIRQIAWAGNFKIGWLIRLAEYWGVILITGGPKSIVAGLKKAREALNNGELVVIFPEGGISRVGHMQGFKPGLMKILEGTNAPVIPVYLDELWGSIFSFDRGKYFWKWPRRWRYPISIHFGPSIGQPADEHEARRAVQDLGAMAVQRRSQRMIPPARSFIRRCKKRKGAIKVSDTNTGSMKGGDLLLRTLILRRLFRRHVVLPGEECVGVLVPPSIGGFVSNMALAIDKRVAVNLNYTVSSDVMNYCIKQAGIKHVITSKKFWDKMNFKLDAEIVFLEDFKTKPTLADKVVAALQSFAMPSFLLERWLGLHRSKADDVLTIIFTSGSTGQPKGVMLTNANIASNVEAIEQVIQLTHKDVLLGILPFFHSLGYTVTMWGVASLDIKGAYHFSPLDGKQVGKLCREFGGTLLLGTPTFLRTYLKRTDKEDFATLDVVVAGAEKLPSELSDAFEEKFGVRPVEGYGTTELSPLVSVNIPKSRSIDNFQIDCKEGTVGRCVPGVTARVNDPDTGQELRVGQSGMLWIKGPNVMKGYLKQPEKTADVIVDGWYKTGDLALIDEDGFVKITGRLSRFSKIGGEMVPHIQIEEMLARIIGAGEDEGLKAAIAAVPDSKKGERLIVVHTALDKSPAELCKGLQEAGLPNLFIPSPDSFTQVDKLPILGSGKLDLNGIKQLALSRFGEGAEGG